MKGTAPRGRTLAEDARRIALLAASAKDRAENVMIVDMMRNDLGRIALPGSVRVESLFDIETFPTVHQMTSTVTAKTQAPLAEIFTALFPCASITGAPKIRTTKIIRRLETGPRGVYTGTIGWLGPGRQARFNVAIRTLSLDLDSAVPRPFTAPTPARATYGTGGGIVWDSQAEQEYEECRTKALVLNSTGRDFELLETLLWRPDSGFFLLERLLERLGASAIYFSFALDRKSIRQRLQRLASNFPLLPHRVRLLLSEQGVASLQAAPMPNRSQRRWRVALDDRPVHSSNVLLFHKTTQRQIYERAMERHPDFDEVLLWNEKKELTESTRANLAIEIVGHWYTPPIDCGLLGGTYRAELLARGRLKERVLPISALRQASRIRLFNSLRGWLGAEIEKPQRP
jgi:para-aminobenzoate synthetase/4-amino-4-deoxychorismate lyase